MALRILDQPTLRELLPYPELIDCMRRTLITLARDEAVQPLRQPCWLPDRSGLVGMMPGYLASPGALGAKVVTVFPGQHHPELDSHQGVVLLFDHEDGRLLALLDGSEVTARRTAAVSAVATDALAPAEADSLALLGSGTQAWTHFEALRTVRPLREVRVFSPNAERCAALVERINAAGVSATAWTDAEGAVRESQIVCTVSSSTTPILRGDWLRPGAHVNAVGACTPGARELDSRAVVLSTLFVDRRESAEQESGDYRIPLMEGLIDDAKIVAELGEVLIGRHPGRRDPDESTVFDSLGLAVEDLAAARLAFDRAEADDLGTLIELGGRRA